MKGLKKLIYMIIILTLGMFILAGCGKKKTESLIVGSWTRRELENSEYIYKEDGKAVLNGAIAKYTINENTLYIEYSENGISYKYTIEIIDDTMTLTNKDGKSFEYVKLK